METKTELLPCPHDGSKVEFCDECDGGCHRIIHDGMEIDLLPTKRQGESLETRRAICAERWNTRVYPPDVQAAIERNIPVQPKLITATREDFDDTFECPSCAKRFSSYDEFDFCPWCGQRLDWSDHD